MARKPRVHFPGGLYHVICRGNQGQQIFGDDADRRHDLELLQETQGRFGYRLYAYVLMGNHVHHLVKVGRIALSKIMQNLLFRYARYWNRRLPAGGASVLWAVQGDPVREGGLSIGIDSIPSFKSGTQQNR